MSRTTGHAPGDLPICEHCGVTYAPPPYQHQCDKGTIAALTRERDALQASFDRERREHAESANKLDEWRLRAGTAEAERDRLAAEVATLKERYDTLHDQRHAEARKADALAAEVGEAKVLLGEVTGEAKRLSGYLPMLLTDRIDAFLGRRAGEGA